MTTSSKTETHAVDEQAFAPREASNTEPMSQQLQHQLCFNLYSTGLMFNKLYRQLLKPFALTYPQYLVLLVLWQQQPQRVSDLANQLFLDAPTLTPLLQRMEKQGHILRVRDQQDERVVMIRLSETGSALQQQMQHIPNCVASALNLSVMELNHLNTQMCQLRAQLQQQ